MAHTGNLLLILWKNAVFCFNNMTGCDHTDKFTFGCIFYTKNYVSKKVCSVF